MISLESLKSTFHKLKANNIIPTLADDVCVKDRIIDSYSKRIFSRLEEILDNNIELTLLDKLDKFLQENWDFVKGTLLCYTALPDAPVTHVLCQVAEYVTQEKNKQNVQNPVSIVNALMPSVTTESISNNFEDLALTETIELVGLLKTYILSDSGFFLIPILLIEKLVGSLDISVFKLDNPYYDYRAHKDQEFFLNENEKYRLYNHSKLTRNIVDIKENLNTLQSDENHVLGNLKKLMRSLKFNNSQSGIGQEKRAGESVYSAIVEFFNYYDTLNSDAKTCISPSIKNELNNLRDFASTPGSIEKIDSCIAIRLEALEKVTQEQEATLSQIGLDKNTLTEQIETTKKNLSQAVEELKKALVNTSEYNGQDLLDIKLSLISALNIEIRLKDMADINLIKDLNPNEIEELLLDETTKNRLIRNVIIDIGKLITISLNFHDGRFRAFFNGLKKEIYTAFIKPNITENLSALLMFVSSDKRTIIENSLRETDLPLTIKEDPLLLHSVAYNPKSLEIILNLYPQADRLAAVKEKDVYGSTVLHRAAYNLDSLKIILEKLPQANRLAAVKEKDGKGLSVLHKAAGHSDSLEIILEKLPQANRLDAVKEKDGKGLSVLHKAAGHSDSLEIILNLYPQADRLAAVKEKDGKGLSVLHKAAGHSDSLEIILNLYPQADRLAAVKEKDVYGSTVLHSAAYNPKSLEIILNLYPQADRLAAVKEKDVYGSTVLHSVAYNPKSLEIILNLYPQADRLAAVKEKDVYGSTVLHSVAYNPKSLEIILNLYPQADRLAAVKEKDVYGSTVLHSVAYNPKSLEIILNLYPQADRLAAVKEKDVYGSTVLHRAVGHSDSLKIILDKLLHVASCQDFDLLISILDTCPEDQRLSVLTKKGPDGNIALHLAITHENPTDVTRILEKLPQKDILAVVTEKNQYGCSILHYAAVKGVDALRQVLVMIPKENRLSAVKDRNEIQFDGKNVLVYMTSYPGGIQMILSLLSEEERIDAVVCKIYEYNYTNVLLNVAIFSVMEEDLKLLKVVMEMLPARDRFVAIEAEVSDDGVTTLFNRLTEKYLKSSGIFFKLFSDTLSGDDKQKFINKYKSNSLNQNSMFANANSANANVTSEVPKA